MNRLFQCEVLPGAVGGWKKRLALGLAMMLLACLHPATAGPVLGGTRQENQGPKSSSDLAPKGKVAPEPVTLKIMEEVIFYDGYGGVVDEPVPEGILRHRNDLYATRLSDEQLASIQNTLTMDVFVGARCDNYDRLGHVFVSFVPKGVKTYTPAEVMRFEVARFVTPFMNMNVEPSVAPFAFELHSLVPMLKDEALLEDHDVWFELSVFGIPYAANKEVDGCEGRGDTASGTLHLHSDSSRDAADFDFALPLAVTENFNNYEEGATDTVGLTRKTIAFDLATDTTATQLVWITSNHGANAGGEEYNRRVHCISVDGLEILLYTPGRASCEPFRKYNTQGNGIYGKAPKTDSEWQSFSNWCPGDVIDTRTIELGAMSAGAHEFVIEVPDAVFAGGQGNIFFSLYLQGR